MKRRAEEIRPVVEQQTRARAMEEYQARLDRQRERVAFCERLVKSLEQEVEKLGGTSAAEELKTLQGEIAAGDERLRKLDDEVRRAENTAANASAAGGWDGTITLRQDNLEHRARLAGIAGSSSGALIVLIVCWREFRRRRVTSASDLVHGLGLPVIGCIPEVRGRQKMTRADLDGQGRVHEAMDALRTVLLRDGASGPRVLLITSAVAGEGKTSLAVRLAASLARGWRKTLLIDADLRKPEAHALFETPLEPGLSEMLRGEAEASDVIQPTGLSRLWIVPAGHGDTHAIQALAQDGAGQLFDRLKEQFEFVILDACPVLPVADALLLSTHADAVLLSVRSGASRVPIIEAARQRLAALHVQLRGAVLMGRDGDQEPSFGA